MHEHLAVKKLSPNDLSLFPHINKNLRGQRFSSSEDTVDAFKNHVLEVSIGVKKQTQMMVVLENILSSVMLKNVKLSYGSVRFHLATPEICYASN